MTIFTTRVQETLFGTKVHKKFEEFHENNPRVYTTLVKLARKLKERGHKKGAIKMLIEIVRWEVYMTTTDKDFKINNNYAPYYARLIMDNEPDLDNFFNLREFGG